MNCKDLYIFCVAFFLSATSVSSVPKDACDNCLEVEKCDLYKQMTAAEQETWIKRFPCQESQKHPQVTFYGFANTAKGDRVCCSDRIWRLETDTDTEETSIEKGTPNSGNENTDSNNWKADEDKHNNSPSTVNHEGIQNPPPVMHSNINGGCSVPSYFPPDPRTGCCGIQVTDQNRFAGRHRRAAPQKANVTLGVRITGGKETELTDFPWTVRLESIFKFPTRMVVSGCGGSLISSRFVLTAEHCVHETEGLLLSVKVYLAEYDKSTFPRDCKNVLGFGEKCIENIVIYGEKAIIHTDFNKRKRSNDIALVKLHGNAPYTDYIRPICLPPVDIDNTKFYGTPLTVAGWGLNGHEQINIKESTIVNLVLQDQCKKFYPDLTRADLCAVGYKGEDICSGDSGGPLMTRNGGRYYVVGIVSGKRADFPCGSAVPSFYTNVFHYIDWIRWNIANN